MSQWLADIASSHRLQLGVTALASGFLAASAVIGVQNAKRWYNIHDLKDSIPDLKSKHDVERVCHSHVCRQHQVLTIPRSTSSVAPKLKWKTLPSAKMMNEVLP